MHSMKQNITLSLEKELIQKARVLAAQRSTSVSKLLADELKRMVDDAERYESARQNALADLEKGFCFGGQGMSPRPEMHAPY